MIFIASKKVNDKEYFEIVQYNKWPNDFDFLFYIVINREKSLIMF